MLYVVIENFANKDPIPVYRRFAERGRLAPDGLRYVASWDFGPCYQPAANARTASASFLTFGASAEPLASPSSCVASCVNASFRCEPDACSALANDWRTAEMRLPGSPFERSS